MRTDTEIAARDRLLRTLDGLIELVLAVDPRADSLQIRMTTKGALLHAIDDYTNAMLEEAR